MRSLDITAMKFSTPLPIDAVLDELRAVLSARASAVLVAPPGAGKTTRVPLALMDESWLEGRKILVLEPRRIAARTAAERERAGGLPGRWRIRRLHGNVARHLDQNALTLQQALETLRAHPDERTSAKA
jgi:hypothetical protein